MSNFDELMRRYKERTACDPSGPIELRVLARVRAQEAASPSRIIALPAFRPGAMAAAMVMGIMAVGLVPVTTSAASPVTDLSIFSPDAPQLALMRLSNSK